MQKLFFTLISLVGLCLCPLSASADILEVISQSEGITRSEARERVNFVFSEIEKELLVSGKVGIRGFGTFYLQRRDARLGRNPSTGETVKVPERVYPKFRSSDTLKERLNEKKV